MAKLIVDDNFLASAEVAQSLQGFARCGECLARAALEPEIKRLANEEAASLQWARCAQCRSTGPGSRGFEVGPESEELGDAPGEKA